MALISWSQQGWLVSWASTYQCHLLNLVRARVHVRVAHVSHIYRSRDCQIMSEHTCQSDVNQSWDSRRPCQRPCPRHTCQSHTCPSHIIRAGIVRDYIRAYFHSWDCQIHCQSHNCQSHINQTGIVRPHQSRTCHSRVAMNTRWCGSPNLMRKISIISGWSLTADIQVKPTFTQFVHVAIGWWTRLECPLTSRQHASWCNQKPSTMLVGDHDAGVVGVAGGSGGRVVEHGVYNLLNEILLQNSSIYLDQWHDCSDIMRKCAL